MRPNKWKSLKEVNTNKEYLAVLSHLPLKSYNSIPLVIKNSAKIDLQLRETKGVIGFSFQAQLLKKQFWTLSVWEDKKLLDDFVLKFPHSEVMSILSPHMKKTEFTYWKITGSEMPPDWKEAKKFSDKT